VIYASAISGCWFLLLIIRSIAFEKSSEIAPGSGQRFAAPGVYKSARTVSLLYDQKKELREIKIQAMYV